MTRHGSNAAFLSVRHLWVVLHKLIPNDTMWQSYYHNSTHKYIQRVKKKYRQRNSR